LKEVRMSKREWKAEDLMRLGSGYWSAVALQAGVQTGLLLELVAGPAAADDLAQRLGLDPRATAQLCLGLKAIGVLEEGGQVLALHPDLVRFMDPDSPRSKVNYVRHMADMVPAWAQLARCVRTGKPVPPPDKPGERGEGQDPPERTHFYLAMRDIAVEQAPGLAGRMGLAGGQSLLDLAGGPGVYALTFAQETPGLEATVFDLPQAEPYFRREAARRPGGDKVGFIVGDYLKDGLGGPYDVIWVSQVLHGEGPGTCRELVAKAAGALKPGGALWVQEFLLGPEAPKHPWPALFTLNMLINTDDGQSYTVGEVIGFMEAAGLVDCAYLGPTKEGGPAALIKGVKP
jgi:ubiquinone/menaquinone biosynthesis C-methylase UbiE